MRITRAYTITPKVKRILDSKINKSDYVCRAVIAKHNEELAFDIRDISTRQLMAALFSREDVPIVIRAAIEAWLSE